MPNPLEALRQAQTIGDPWQATPVQLQDMMGPPGGGRAALQGLRWLGGKLGIGAAEKLVPGALQEASRGIPAAAETLGEQNPYFTPAGGEGMYNAAKQTLQKIVDPVEKAYNQLLQRGGR